MKNTGNNILCKIIAKEKKKQLILTIKSVDDKIIVNDGKKDYDTGLYAVVYHSGGGPQGKKEFDQWYLRQTPYSFIAKV